MNENTATGPAGEALLDLLRNETPAGERWLWERQVENLLRERGYRLAEALEQLPPSAVHFDQIGSALRWVLGPRPESGHNPYDGLRGVPGSMPWKRDPARPDWLDTLREVSTETSGRAALAEVAQGRRAARAAEQGRLTKAQRLGSGLRAAKALPEALRADYEPAGAERVETRPDGRRVRIIPARRKKG